MDIEWTTNIIGQFRFSRFHGFSIFHVFMSFLFLELFWFVAHWPKKSVLAGTHQRRDSIVSSNHLLWMSCDQMHQLHQRASTGRNFSFFTFTFIHSPLLLCHVGKKKSFASFYLALSVHFINVFPFQWSHTCIMNYLKHFNIYIYISIVE